MLHLSTKFNLIAVGDDRWPPPLPPAGYLVPVLCVVFSVLWIFCIVVCVWWTRKRKKERERATRSEDTTVNNQLEPLRSNALKDNRDKDIQYECKKLMGPSDRTGDGAEGEEEGEQEGEQEDDEERAMGMGEKCPPQKCSITGAQDRGMMGKGGVICTSRSGPVKAPHRTAYSPKDNRCKNLNAAKLSEDVKDHYVWTRERRKKQTAMSSNVTDFFLKKAPKVKITDALIFYCFVFVTRYLTSSRPAAPTLFYQKPTQKKCRKINKLKKLKKNDHHSFWISGFKLFIVTLLESRRIFLFTSPDFIFLFTDFCFSPRQN